MKRIVSTALILVVVFLILVYIFIPPRIEVKSVVPMRCNGGGADRALGDTSTWDRWWPGDNRSQGREENGALSFRGSRYRINRRLLRSFEIGVAGKGNEVMTMLSVFPGIYPDSSSLIWTFNMECGPNPIDRIIQYQRALALKDDMDTIMGHIRAYLTEDHVYGISIREMPVGDSLIVENTRLLAGNPTTADIYEDVRKVRSYILAHGGKVTGYPKVNITKRKDGCLLRVALPTDTPMPGSGNIKMNELYQGRHLETEVRGGDGTINEAMLQMNNYINDYHRTVIAVPFLSLVTDRSAEPDSTKWITRIFYPVF
jgi:hypothetical protein